MVVGDSPDSPGSPAVGGLELLVGIWLGDLGAAVLETAGVVVPAGDLCCVSCIESSLSLLEDPLELPINKIQINIKLL